jgi:hydroxymethylpyrimidine/phosphomethylpyrimidine kinase
MGAKNIVITVIETKINQISDFVLEKNNKYFISGNKISKINHGSGCNYSAAMIFALAENKSIRESAKFAKQFTYNSIKNAKKENKSIRESAKFAKQFTYNSIKNAKNLGMGIAITDIQECDKINSELSDAINQFVEIKNIYKNIPECQTNFVYSKQKPKSTKDILGISGRIVKVGRHAMVAGNLTYGGSKHVATALLIMNKRFPQIRSAINLKYQNITILKIKKLKLMVSSYDRSHEPKNVKLKSSTIEWGIKSTIKNSKKVLDVVYHKGDFGKEPMIIVFGNTPNNVLKKILKII